MGNYSDHNWQRRWRVDLDARTALHESGLVVRFREHPDGGRCGELEKIPPGLMSAGKAARLMREAEEVYKHALDRKQ